MNDKSTCDFPELSPLDYKFLCHEIRSIQLRYSFLHCSSIGKSLLGKELFKFDLGNPRNKVLFVASFHGMEWITGLLLLKFARNLCYAVENRTELSGIPAYPAIQKSGVCLIPCINPDGVEIMLQGAKAAKRYQELVLCASSGDTSHWQANARGVDLNHNFNAGWFTLRRMESSSGIIGPSPTRYGGAAPESEPESAALACFCRHHGFRHATAFHSQGEEIYYNYGCNTPDCSLEIAQKLAQYSGYRLSKPEGLASMGGFKDWFIDYFCRPAFTIEIGLGKNPLPIESFHEIYSRLEPMLIRAILL